MQLGTDPELFIVDGRGRPVSAHTLFPDKHHKMRPDPHNRFAVFRDGYAVEINVPPDVCRETLTSRVFNAHNWLAEYLRPHGYTLLSAPSVKVNLASLEGAPWDVLTFGCDPAWSAYSGEPSVCSLDASAHPYRYAGGHMHISTGLNPASGEYSMPWMADPERVLSFVKYMDLYVGLPLSLWFHHPRQYRRRQYYGKAGEFRFQHYGRPHTKWGRPTAIGVEYRTPGPELWNHPAVASFAFGVMGALARRMHEGTLLPWDAAIEDDLRDAINNGRGGKRLLHGLTEQWGAPDLLASIARARPFPRNLSVPHPEYIKARVTPYSSHPIDVPYYTFGWDRWKLNAARHTPTAT